MQWLAKLECVLPGATLPFVATHHEPQKNHIAYSSHKNASPSDASEYLSYSGERDSTISSGDAPAGKFMSFGVWVGFFRVFLWVFIRG